MDDSRGAGWRGRRGAWVAIAAVSGLLTVALADGAGAQGVPESGPTGAPAATSEAGPASEELRARVAQADAEAARLTEVAREWAEKAARLAQAREQAPEVLVRIEAEVAGLKERGQPEVDRSRPLAELETELLGGEQDLALARTQLAEIERESAERTERRKQIPELLAAAKERLLALAAEPVAAAEPALVEARQRLAAARRQALENEIAAYEEELRSYDARGRLLALRREHANLRVAALEAQVAALREAVTALRQGEAADAAEEALRSIERVGDMPPAVLDELRRIAAGNRELALERMGPDGLLQKIEETSRKLGRAGEQVAAVTADLDFLERNVEAGGLSGSVGLLLRKTRSEAPDVGMYRRFIRMRRSTIGEVQLQQIELGERRRALDDLDAVVARKLGELDPYLDAEDRAAAESVLRGLFETRRRYLDTLIADTETYFERLVDFDAKQQELVSRAESLRRFIDERVLWIPSGAALSPAMLDDVREAMSWLLSPRFWGQVGRALVTAAGRSPLAFLAAGLLLLALPLGWPRLRREVVRLGEQANRPDCIRVTPTLVALLLTLLMALWGPGLLGFLGWRLGASVNATQFVRCVAAGLMAAASVWVTLLVPRQLLRSQGIAVAHLGWPETAARSLRRQLQWLASVAVPAVFVIALFEMRGEPAWRESVGRLAFLVLLAGAFVFTHRVLRSGTGSLRRIAVERAGRAVPAWVWRALHVLALTSLGGLIVAAGRGYFWTALQLAASVHVTLTFLVLVVFAYQLGARWLLLASRRLALQRWQKAQAERASRPVDPMSETPSLEEPEVDLATVDEQTGRILRNGALLLAVLGVWAIWADLLPAAAALRSVELWKVNVTETVEMMNAAGETITSVEDRLTPITLADLLLALVVGSAMLALARNLPGLLEVALFRQLQTSAGERYAYATIGKYAVTFAGVAAALNIVGVGWSSIQWLLAAVGIGLGFGLQEIFANFVSGLIILFERPIRVGDTVTVGDISGTVTRIRIRATWITGFDRKELVVPNKEFITGRLVNWSLSDAVLRVEIPVGIAYGSDTRRAHRVLEEVARANAHVLADPPPLALFRGFGASSLDFELRVYSPDVGHYLRIVHELHMEIDRAFRAEGIEIAFPQRDIHVRSLPVAGAHGPDDAGA